MLEQMPWRIYKEWKQFHGDDPFDEQRGDYRAAQLAWIMATAWLRDSKKPNTWTIDDFLLKFSASNTQAESEADEAERLLRKAMDITIIFGGTIDGAGNNTSQAAGTD